MTTVPSSKISIKDRLLHNLKYQKALGLSTVLETEVVIHLLEGKKSVGQLVRLVYGTEKDDPEFEKNYMRVSRALQPLESKGYVSRRLFGSSKPYRITHYALDKIANIETSSSPSLAGRWDVATFLGLVAVASGTYLTGSGFIPVSRLWFMFIYTVLVFLFGVCTVRLVQMVKRVW